MKQHATYSEKTARILAWAKVIGATTATVNVLLPYLIQAMQQYGC